MGNYNIVIETLYTFLIIFVIFDKVLEPRFKLNTPWWKEHDAHRLLAKLFYLIICLIVGYIFIIVISLQINALVFTKDATLHVFNWLIGNLLCAFFKTLNIDITLATPYIYLIGFILVISILATVWDNILNKKSNIFTDTLYVSIFIFAVLFCFTGSLYNLIMLKTLLGILMFTLVYLSTEDDTLSMLLLYAMLILAVLSGSFIIYHYTNLKILADLAVGFHWVVDINFSSFLVIICVPFINELTNFLGCGTLFFKIYDSMPKNIELTLRLIIYPIFRIFFIILMTSNNFYGFKAIIIVYMLMVYISTIAYSIEISTITDLFIFISKIETLILYVVYLIYTLECLSIPLVLVGYYIGKDLVNYIAESLIIKYCKTLSIAGIARCFVDINTLDKFLFIFCLIIMPFMSYIFCIYIFYINPEFVLTTNCIICYAICVAFVMYYQLSVWLPIFTGRLGKKQMEVIFKYNLQYQHLFLNEDNISYLKVNWYRTPLIFINTKVRVTMLEEHQLKPFKLTDKERIYLIVTGIHLAPLPYIDMYGWLH